MDPFQPIREHLLAMPGVTERLSHGSPTFFAPGSRGKSFCMCHDDHHGDGRLAVWLAAAEGVQEALISEDPEVYFRPPYVGPKGWVGVRLDRGLDLEVVRGLVEDAHEAVS